MKQLLMRVPSLLALIDLDHTLFKTEEFWEAVTELLGRRFGIPVAQFRAGRLDRSPSGPGRTARGEGYDFFVHLGLYGVDPDEAETAIIAELGPDANQRNRWLNPGALTLIEYLRNCSFQPVIKTTGAHRFQMLKVHCAGLADIPVETLEGNKGEDFASAQDESDVFVYQGVLFKLVVFIDDSDATFEALDDRPGLICVQILGSPKHPRVSPYDWVHKVQTLEEIPPLIEALLVSR
jgi:hypothetical protein